MAEITFTPVDARSVANRLLACSVAEGLPVTPMQLLKMTYIAHGWFLGMTNEPLVVQQVLAWPYGPVIPDVYHAFKGAGSSPVKKPAIDYSTWKPFPTEMHDYMGSVVDRVWDQYKTMSGAQLSAITHEPESPWSQVTRGKEAGQIRDIPIPNETIADYYGKLVKKNWHQS